jgi:hypothetical protein
MKKSVEGKKNELKTSRSNIQKSMVLQDHWHDQKAREKLEVVQASFQCIRQEKMELKYDYKLSYWTRAVARIFLNTSTEKGH